MTQTQYFEWLGAPLVNTRWSWGAVRSDGVIFLRAWQDETSIIDGKRHILVAQHLSFVDDQSNLGYRERMVHVELIRQGAKCFIVMVEADLALLPTRVIKDFNSDEVFSTGLIRQNGGDEWIELRQRVPATHARKVS